MRISVAPALWPGETMREIRAATSLAAEAGIGELWFSEVNGYDALVLSSAIAASGAAGTTALNVGPLPVGVRDPALLAMGLATLQAAHEGEIGVALGTSTPTIVESWHGRRVGDPVEAVQAFLPALKDACAGARLSGRSGVGWSSDGFKLGVPGLDVLRVTVAALGERMLEFAGEHGDRVVVNLVTPDLISDVKDRISQGATRGGRRPPQLAVWLMTGSKSHALERAASLLPPYADAPGYSRVLETIGMANLIRKSPRSAAEQLGAFDDDALSDRIHEFGMAGVDEVVIVVSGADPGASHVVEQARSMEDPS